MSPVKHSTPFDEEGEHPVGVARRVEALDPQVARLDDVAVDERALDVLQPRGLERMREHGHREPVEVVLELRDVVAVVVGEEDVGDGQAEAVDRLEDRLDRAAGVDQHRVPARAVADDVAVREPAGGHRALEDHGRASGRGWHGGGRARG